MLFVHRHRYCCWCCDYSCNRWTVTTTFVTTIHSQTMCEPQCEPSLDSLNSSFVVVTVTVVTVGWLDALSMCAQEKDRGGALYKDSFAFAVACDVRACHLLPPLLICVCVCVNGGPRSGARARARACARDRAHGTRAQTRRRTQNAEARFARRHGALRRARLLLRRCGEF